MTDSCWRLLINYFNEISMCSVCLYRTNFDTVRFGTLFTETPFSHAERYLLKKYDTIIKFKERKVAKRDYAALSVDDRDTYIYSVS